MHKKTVEVVIHVFAHELHEFQRVIEQIKRNLSVFEGSDQEKRWSFFFVLNVSRDYYDWQESQINADFFCQQFKQLISLLPNINSKIITRGDYGVNSARRERIKDTKSDFLCFIDPDIHFSIDSFLYILQGIDILPDDALFILSGQITRFWNDDYNVISNDKFIKMGIESEIWNKYDPYGVDHFVMSCKGKHGNKFVSDGCVIFGGGLLNVLDINMLRFIGIPNSFGSYGMDDTFISSVINDLMLDYDEPLTKPFKQVVLENVLVAENRLYKDQFQPYLSYLKFKSSPEDVIKNNQTKCQEIFFDELDAFHDDFMRYTNNHRKKNSRIEANLTINKNE